MAADTSAETFDPPGPLRIRVTPRRDDYAQVADPLAGVVRTDTPPGLPTGSLEGVARVPATSDTLDGIQRIQPAPVQSVPPSQPDMAGFTRALGQMEQPPTPEPAPAQRPSWFDKMLEPITSYPATEAQYAADARDQVFKGVRQLGGEIDPQTGETNRLGGAFNTVVGGISYPLAPVNAALHTVVGKPLEENTGLPHQYSEFAAGLALPGIGFGRVPKTVEKIFSPETVSPEAMEAAALIRQRSGLAARDTESTAATLESWQKPVNQLPPAQQLGIMHYIEGTGPAPATPELRALADTLKAAFELRKQKLQALPSHAQMNFIEDYFPHFWTDPNAAQNAVRSGAFLKQGSGASTKARTVPTIEEGINQGLTPLTTNPIEATLRYVTSMDKFIASQEILQTAKKQGTLIYRRPTAMGASGHPDSIKGIPPGYAPLEGRGSRDAAGAIAYAPEDWARIYNNYISPGITGPYRDVYDMVRRASNAVTQTLLSLSGYHAFTMAEADMSSRMARTIAAARGGDIGGTVKELGKYAVSPVTAASTTPMKGAYLRDVYLGKRMPLSAQDREIVDLITQAGGRMGSIKHALDYESSALGDFLTSFRRGRLRMELAEQGRNILQNPISGTAKTVASNIGRLMDTMNKPLFQHYIPAMKNAAAYENLAQFLKQNPGATQAEKLAAARKVVDSVDNRFGEMINDNVFWNKTQKQIALVAMLSYSWNMGGWREIGGGVRDIARTAVARGEWTPKADYVVGMAINWAIMSAAYQYMKTGEAPRDTHDLVAPRTGGIDSRSGEPERIIPPGIMKDVFGYYEHFGQEVINKLNPFARLAGQTASITMGQGGNDWRGDPILSPRSPGQTMLEKTPDWLTEYFRFVTKTMTPIQIQNLSRGKEEGSNLNSFEQSLGIRKAPRQLIAAEGYEKMLDRLWQRRWMNKQRHDKAEQNRYGGTGE